MYLDVSFSGYADLSSLLRVSVNGMFCSCILSVTCSADSIVVYFCVITMFLSVLVVEDSECSSFDSGGLWWMLLVTLGVIVFKGSCGILNACSLILVCVLFVGELVLCVFCCGSVSDRDKFVGSCISIWSSYM